MSVEAYFAQRMRDIRNLQGISQKVLADKVTERLGYAVDPTAVTRMEKNVGDLAILRMEKGARMIRLGEAVAIAEVLGVPLSELLPEGAGGEQRQIVQLPPSLVERLRALHEVTGAVIRLAEPGVAS
jgi:transcriptional regulator with XRE-family HTH domain